MNPSADTLPARLITPTPGERTRPEENAASAGAADVVSTPWWRGRYGLQLLREAVVVTTLIFVYLGVRYFVRDQASDALHNARSVLLTERRFGIATEDDFQRLIISHRWLVSALNRYYASAHFPATIAFLTVVYLRAPFQYRIFRRLFVAVTALGLFVHTIYPLAPPRMMPGFIDTMARFGPKIYSDSTVAGVANQFAAMPSLHFGWAVLVAYGTIRMTRGTWRWLVVAHPVITLAAIVATANHYWMDALVALVLVVVSVAVLCRPLKQAATVGAPLLAGAPCD